MGGDSDGQEMQELLSFASHSDGEFSVEVDDTYEDTDIPESDKQKYPKEYRRIAENHSITRTLTPRSILRLKQEEEEGNVRIKKSVSWPDITQEGPLQEVCFIPLSGVDRKPIQTTFMQAKRARLKKKEDRFFVTCCGSVILLLVCIAALLAFLLVYFGY